MTETHSGAIGDLIEEYVRSGRRCYILIHHPDCVVYEDGADEDDCSGCDMAWIGPFGMGFRA